MPSWRLLLLLLLPTLLPLAACSDIDPVPAHPAHAVRVYACLAADGSRCVEAFVGAPSELAVSATEIRRADIAVAAMDCPMPGDVAVASCPAENRIAICDLGGDAILGRTHLYAGAGHNPDDCHGPRLRLHRLVPATR